MLKSFLAWQKRFEKGKRTVAFCANKNENKLLLGNNSKDIRNVCMYIPLSVQFKPL